MNDDYLRGHTARICGLPFDPHESDDWQSAWISENDNGRSESDRRMLAVGRRVGELTGHMGKVESLAYELRIADPAASKFLELAERLNGLSIFVRDVVHPLAVERDALRADEYRSRALKVATNPGGLVVEVSS